MNRLIQALLARAPLQLLSTTATGFLSRSQASASNLSPYVQIPMGRFSMTALPVESFVHLPLRGTSRENTVLLSSGRLLNSGPNRQRAKICRNLVKLFGMLFLRVFQSHTPSGLSQNCRSMDRMISGCHSRESLPLPLLRPLSRRRFWVTLRTSRTWTRLLNMGRLKRSSWAKAIQAFPLTRKIATKTSE